MNIIFNTPATALLDLIFVRVQLVSARDISKALLRSKSSTLGDLIDDIITRVNSKLNRADLEIILNGANDRIIEAKDAILYGDLISYIDEIIRETLR